MYCYYGARVSSVQRLPYASATPADRMNLRVADASFSAPDLMLPILPQQRQLAAVASFIL